LAARGPGWGELPPHRGPAAARQAMGAPCLDRPSASPAERHVSSAAVTYGAETGGLSRSTRRFSASRRIVEGPEVQTAKSRSRPAGGVIVTPSIRTGRLAPTAGGAAEGSSG